MGRWSSLDPNFRWDVAVGVHGRLVDAEVGSRTLRARRPVEAGEPRDRPVLAHDVPEPAGVRALDAAHPRPREPVIDVRTAPRVFLELAEVTLHGLMVRFGHFPVTVDRLPVLRAHSHVRRETELGRVAYRRVVHGPVAPHG